ncbi:Protein ASP-7 [Aphelenchoides avenae]|nr:Protein ASP-7 [Aphelenchus avenae]
MNSEASKTIRKWKPEKVVSDGSATINEPVSFPLFGSGTDREFFVVNAAIGTPPQFFNLTLDTFTGGVVVYTRDPVVPPAQNEQRCTVCECATQNRSSSSTYRLLEGGDDHGAYVFGYRLVPYADANCVKYFNGFMPTGNASSDYVHLCASAPHGQCISNGVPRVRTSLLTADHVSVPLNSGWSSDGILGLHWYDYISVLNAFTAKQLSIAVKRTSLGGRLLEGGKQLQACVDSVSPYLGVNHTVLAKIARAVNADYDFKTDRYTVECAKRQTAPDLEFYVNDDTKLSVSAVDYIRPFSTSGKCTLMVTTNEGYFDAPLYYEYWMLGIPYLRSNCVAMDTVKKTMSFAKTK